MESKNSIGLIILSVALIILSICLGGYIFYDKVLNKPEDTNKVEDKPKDITNNKQSETISVNDKFAYAIDKSYDSSPTEKLRLQLFLVEDGYLYYKCKFLPITENIYDYTMDLPTISKEEPKLEKYTEIKNIKRIKGTNTISSSVDFNILAITEDGKVYSVYFGNNGEINFDLDNDFKNYKVEDILEYEPVTGCIEGYTCNSSYTIITKDGQKITQ